MSVKPLIIAALPLLVVLFFLVRPGQADAAPEDGRPGASKIMGWKVEEGRFVDGPYKGYLVGRPDRKDRIEKSEEQWRAILTDEQFRILRTKGTEAAFCGVFHDNKKEGIYKVAGTGQPVFKSGAKFDSGTGWPSFFEPFDRDAVYLEPDFSHGMVRMEVLASRCGGHLGHVFPDGPSGKGGLRFCINSDALTFEERKASEG
jgi:methionine-R-sulfoxide reductase